MTLKIDSYRRKPFDVVAVQVTHDNLEEVAKWCGGKVVKSDVGPAFVKVPVKFPNNPRQTEAQSTDWVLRHAHPKSEQYKVYTRAAFDRSFEKVEAENHEGQHELFRSAETGQFITGEEAEENPSTTVSETVD